MTKLTYNKRSPIHTCRYRPYALLIFANIRVLGKNLEQFFWETELQLKQFQYYNLKLARYTRQFHQVQFDI